MNGSVASDVEMSRCIRWYENTKGTGRDASDRFGNTVKFVEYVAIR